MISDSLNRFLAESLLIKSQLIDIHGTQINYVDEGNGPVLLLIHGLGADLSRWQHNIAPLSRRYRVIAIDLPGFGLSERSEDEYSGRYFVSRIKAFLQALCIQKVTLMGNSMGGWLSMLFAQRYPNAVSQLILVAPAFYKGLPDGVSPSQVALAANPQNIDDMRAYLERVLHSPPSGTGEIEAALQAHKQRNKGQAISKVVESLSTGRDIFNETELSELDIPVLIVQGESDGIVPPQASRTLAQKLADARLVTMDEAGHWPQFEQPAAFNQIVLGHLQQR